jgi:Protein of unknown function (DUF2384)
MATKYKEKAVHSADEPETRNGHAMKASPKGKAGRTRAAKLASQRQPRPTVPSSRLAEPIPDEATIRKLLSSLDAPERSAVSRILKGLEEQFGSAEAARIWLATKSPEFGETPLATIRSGKAKLLQAVLEARRGPNPTYA